ncbi:aminotransferase class I/II-fold pyridoxal phosphate-dependent enzyme [Paenibacillus sp. LMG 31461]|uniref:Aminotransferase class I/II-fold pyridoxal phosphate-dependent enzyme n=1 Tax=Paenibacillus plantarum TaxID=2654975 RepID=A0ABX1XCR2_9BACL|nr:DegT/DnrJ/EryC1/StrS family aminotransferase [Paenibacillus plantarum]NOU66252.1 aminotransferase class I/II-fold pyridoxal phosphate-dependent enzyme [Paenibacillus plantarum]
MIKIAQPQIGQEEIDAVSAVLRSGQLASGENVALFQKEFSEYLNQGFCIAASSGTTALEIALRALGIKEGDKIITTAFSFIATANVIIHAGATPIFADIDERTMNISSDSIEQILQEQEGVKAILIVHLFGQSCDMDQIQGIANRYQLLLVEDCAQAHGAEWKGRKLGTFGDASAFSFYPTKNMTTAEGGMVVFKNKNAAVFANQLIQHGIKARNQFEFIGYNYRLSEISAAIGLCQLKKLDRFNSARRDNAALYDENIDNFYIIKPQEVLGAMHVYNQYTLRILNGMRDAFIAHMEKEGVSTSIYYPYTIPEQACYRATDLLEKDYNRRLGVSNRIKHEVVSIPIHPGLTSFEVERIITAINRF